jgi:alkylation response protein AidB-like acyl-CoA dehydrogenase
MNEAAWAPVFRAFVTLGDPAPRTVAERSRLATFVLFVGAAARSATPSKAAWLYDTAGDPGEAANMAKYAAGEASLRALDQAIQTHGGNGMATEYGLADLWGPDPSVAHRSGQPGRWC